MALKMTIHKNQARGPADAHPPRIYLWSALPYALEKGNRDVELVLRAYGATQW